MTWRTMLLIACLPAVAITYFLQSQGLSDPKCSRSGSENPVGVAALMETPQCFSGDVRIQGLVSKLLPEKRSLTLIDLKEEDDCDDKTCPIRRLPVQWDGTMPARKAKVLVLGKIEKRDGKLVFNARSVETDRKAQAR